MWKKVTRVIYWMSGEARGNYHPLSGRLFLIRKKCLHHFPPPPICLLVCSPHYQSSPSLWSLPPTQGMHDHPPWIGESDYSPLSLSLHPTSAGHPLKLLLSTNTSAFHVPFRRTIPIPSTTATARSLHICYVVSPTTLVVLSYPLHMPLPPPPQ